MGNKNKLYDSYIRAIRWASDRIQDEGVVAFVSNGGYIDGTSADGLRNSLVEEFDAIYCYNLRGNQRTAGEQSQKEGGKIFGSGSRNTVAILLLVKGSKASTAESGCMLRYRDIGDYLSRDDKLRILNSQGLDTIEWEEITPNADGDWINQRSEDYATFQAIGDKDKKLATKVVFSMYSSGLNTARDAWVYNFSAEKVRTSMESMIDFYNKQVDGFRSYCANHGLTAPGIRDAEKWIDTDPKKISWNRADKTRLTKEQKYVFDAACVVTSTYRPFAKQKVYFNSRLNDMTYQLPRLFPSPEHGNQGFYIVGSGSAVPFSVLVLDTLPNLHVTGAGSGGTFFPRYTYRELGQGDDLFAAAELNSGGFERVTNITTAAVTAYRETYADPDITGDDIFFYTYGLLHSPAYREQFAADLKKSLPRIPQVQDFQGFAEAGRALSKLHLGYEQAEPYAGIVEQVSGATSSTPPSELFRVGKKMKFRRVKGQVDRTAIVYNPRVTLTNIPEEAFRYQLGARSAIEWIIDRYWVKTDKDSGIVNDPNDWSEDPRYIIDLLKRIVTVSLDTMKIVDALPPLDIIE